MIVVIFIFICGALGAASSARKNYLECLVTLFLQSIALYGALLFSGVILEFVPKLPFPYGDAVKTVGIFLLTFVALYLLMGKLVSSIVPSGAWQRTELPIPQLGNKILSWVTGFFSGCVFACLFAIVLVWGAFSLRLPVLSGQEFRDSVQAHVSFFVGTMNVFTWSSSYAPIQKKQIKLLFPEEKSKDAPKDKLSSLSEKDAEALTKNKKDTSKKKRKKRKSSGSHRAPGKEPVPASQERSSGGKQAGSQEGSPEGDSRESAMLPLRHFVFESGSAGKILSISSCPFVDPEGALS